MKLKMEKGPDGAVADAVVMTSDANGESPADDVKAYLMTVHDISEDIATDWIASAKHAGEIRLRPFQVPQYLGVFSGHLKRDVDKDDNWQVDGEVVGEVNRYVWDFMLSVPVKPVPLDFKEVG